MNKLCDYSSPRIAKNSVQIFIWIRKEEDNRFEDNVES